MKIIHDVRRSWGSAARRGARALLLLAASGMLAWAAPQGAKVVKGNVAIANSGNLTTITASNNSIINYTGFNILPAEVVRFIQPGATARVYNEVNSPDPSVIAGRLLANGIVYLFNPSGIVFANGCVVNAGAIYAAAAKLSEQNFVNGVNSFSGASGAVVNNGTISGQAVVLFGSTVLNTGTILAPKGFVVLAAGNDLYLCEDGSQIMVKLPGAAATGQSGAANAGGTAAPQATASLGAGDMYSILVHNTGTVQAQNITLQASATGAVKVEGALDASNTAPGGVGGTVNVLGGEVDLVGAHINASGAAGGGTVLIGGGLHGQSGTPTAQITTVDQNSSIKADAISTGNGGEVVVWSDLATLCYGQISARGGAHGGNGGLVETSGHYLDVSGAQIDTFAPKGTTGTWLLDPYDITIDATDTTTITPTTSAGTTTYLSSILSDIPPSYLNVGDLETALSSTNVLVQTGSGGSALGNITVASPITWASGFSLTLDAINNINVNASITGTGAGNLNLWAGNNVSISAPISLGGILNVNGYSADGYGATFTSPPTVTFSVPSTTSSPAVTTAGGQTYNGPVTLDADTALTDTGPGVTFSSTVDSVTAAPQVPYSLTVNGNAAFGGAVGVGNPLSSLDVTGTTAMNAGTVTTSGDQSYGGSVTLAQDTALQGGTLQSVSGTPIKVLGGGYDLGLAFGGTTVINGNLVANVNNLNVSGGAVQLLNTITTTSEQVYYDSVTLTGNTMLNGSLVMFYNTVNGAYSLEVNGYAGLQNAVGNSTPLASLDVNGPTLMNAGTISTTGGQTYNGIVTLDSNTALTDTGPGVTFSSTVDSVTAAPQVPYSLTVNGNAAFGGAVGGGNPLSSLDVTGTTAMDAGTVTTTGGQTYNGAVTLSAPATLTDSGPGVVFDSTVDGGFSLTVNGDAEFNGAVGSNVPLQTVHVTGTTDFYWDAYASGTASAQTTGDQNYDGPVTLHANIVLEADYTGNGVVFGSTLDSDSTPRELGLYSNAQFFKAVGGTNPLSLLYVNGAAYIATDTITTTTSNGGDGQAGFNGAVVVADGVSVNLAVPGTSGPGGTYGVSFYSTVNGETLGTGSLTVTGNALFEGAIGNVTSLSSLDVTGTTAMDAGTVATTGGQTYNGAVTLDANTALTDTGPGVTFNSTIDSATATTPPQVPYSLTVNGNAAFNGLVGSVEPLSGLVVTGTTAMNAGAVTTTTGEQEYEGPVTLGATTALTGSSYMVFFSTLNGAYSLTVNGEAAFAGAVGNSAPLLSLDVTGTTAMDAGTVATTGGQTYNGAVALYSNTALTDTGPGVTFNSTVDSVTATTPPQVPYSLTVNGHAAFNGSVGSIEPLSSLDVNGTTAMKAGTVTTSAGQTYNGAVTLGADTLLTDTGAGVTFDSTVDGGYLLEVNGNAVFEGAVGNLTPLSALEVIGTTEMDAGTVTTTGVQIYNGAVTLSLDTALATDGASTHDILFGSSINGAHSLTLDAGAFGDILVEGAIGNTNALTILTVTDSNGTTFNGSVTAGTIALLNTTGAITFGGNVTATSLITAAQPYVIVFKGDNIITNPVTFLNAGGVVNGGAIFGNLVTAIPNTTEQPAPWYDPTSYPESLALSPADLETLRDLGIWGRSLTPGEVAGLLLDNQLLAADLPMKANPDPSDFTVAANRLPARETQNLLAQYRGIFWKGGLYQADAICASFERALADYRKLGAKFTPGNFAEYVLGHQDGDAYRYGTGIKSLLTTLESLGLTSRDFRAAKEVLLNRVKPAGLSTVDFARVIEGL